LSIEDVVSAVVSAVEARIAGIGFGSSVEFENRLGQLLGVGMVAALVACTLKLDVTDAEPLVC
jgi:hypothetical protein